MEISKLQDSLPQLIERCVEPDELEDVLWGKLEVIRDEILKDALKDEN